MVRYSTIPVKEKTYRRLKKVQSQLAKGGRPDITLDGTLRVLMYGWRRRRSKAKASLSLRRRKSLVKRMVTGDREWRDLIFPYDWEFRVIPRTDDNP